MSTPLDKLPVVAPATHVPGPGQGQWSYKEYAALPDVRGCKRGQVFS